MNHGIKDISRKKLLKRELTTIVVSILGILLLSSIVSAFNFNGTTHISSGNNLSLVNVSVTVYNFSSGFTPVTTVDVTSDSSGWFNMTLPDYGMGYGYKVSLVKDNGSVIYVGKPLPAFPSQELQMVSPINFYLKAGAKLNITAFNSTGSPKSFNYQIKDKKLGYPIEDNFNAYVTQKIAYVQADRNYSVMIYPNQSMPRYRDISNIAAYSTTDAAFNLTNGFARVTGYAKLSNGSTGFDSFHIIPYLLEPGDMIFPAYSAMPANLSAMRGDGSSDIFNATSGWFNITLITAPSPGVDVMFFFIANDSNGARYGSFRNLTLLLTSQDITVSDFNATMVRLEGGANESISQWGMMGPGINTSVTEVNFSIRNSTGSSITGSAFVDMSVDYSNISSKSFHLLTDVSESASGYFSLPLLSGYSTTLKIFSGNFAPRRLKLSAAQLSADPVIINMTTFNPGAINESEFNGSDIFIDMIKSTAECNVPNYNASLCSLFPQGGRMNFTQFNPLSVIMGGGDISFVMGRTSNGITVIYKNADLLASGPPDALFDGSASSSSSGNVVEEAWRFGSQGPEIYDSVLVGVPYNTSLNASTINVTIQYLYDDDWNIIWNVSSDGTTPGNNITDYADFNQTWFSGMPCSITDANASCYVDASRGFVWMSIPHFSGVGPAVSGSGTSSGAVNFTIIKSALNSIYGVGDIVEYTINITNNGANNITLITLNDTFDSTKLSLSSASVLNSSAGSGWLYWGNLTNGSVVQPNASFVLYLNMTTLAEGSGVNNSALANSTDSASAAGTANATVSITIDGTAPSVSAINSPSSGSNLSTGVQIFNATVTDSVAGVDTVRFNITNGSSSVILTASNVTSNYWNASLNLGALAEEQHTMIVLANDSVGNLNNSESVTFTVDRTAPAVSIVNSSFNTTDTTPSITFNYTDALFATASCTLYFNGVLKGMDPSVANATNTVITPNTTTDGTYTVDVNCTDGSGNEGNSSSITVVVDTGAPAVSSFNSPSNSSFHNSNFALNVTVTGSPSTVQYRIENGTNSSDISVNYTGMSNPGGNYWNATVNISLLADSNYTIRINATDSSGNSNTTETILVGVDTTNPSISSFSCTDINVGGSQSCSCSATDNSQSFGGSVSTSVSSASTSTAGTKTVTCTATDSAGNTATGDTTYTVSSTGGGSGSTGSSGGVSTGASGQFEKKVWTSINSGESASVTTTDGDIGVTEVEFKVDKTVWGAWIKVAKKDNLPGGVSDAGKKVYKYIEITKGPALKDDIITDAKIRFKVPKEWLNNNNMDKDETALYRYHGDIWTELSTDITKEDSNYVYYEASTPGFSYFAIGKKEVVPTSKESEENISIENASKEEISTVNKSSAKNESNMEDVSKSNNWWLFGSLGALLIIVLAFIYYIYSKRK